MLIDWKYKICITESLFSDSVYRYLSGCLFYLQCTIHKTNVIIRTCKSTWCDGISSNLAIVYTACFYIITCKCKCTVQDTGCCLSFAIHKSIILGCKLRFFAVLNRLILCPYGQCSLFDNKLLTRGSRVIAGSGNRHFCFGSLCCSIGIVRIYCLVISNFCKCLTTKRNGKSRCLCCSGINQIICAGDCNASCT